MIINIKTDKNSVITGYAVVGKINGGTDIHTEYESIDDIPPLSVGYYKLEEGKIVIDEDLKAQIEKTQ